MAYVSFWIQHGISYYTNAYIQDDSNPQDKHRHIIRIGRCRYLQLFGSPGAITRNHANSVTRLLDSRPYHSRILLLFTRTKTTNTGFITNYRRRWLLA